MLEGMEANKIGAGAGAGQVRRINIVYFLSRHGKVEHPHLVRVHHFYRSGVHLRDVKRWLSELRGPDMPDSFAWSYKRRYKSAYVWQDLLDDDLITPISDNEYVIKGSELFFSSNKLDDTLFPSPIDGLPEKASEVETSPPRLLPLKTPPETLQIDVDDRISPKPPPRLEESPVLPGGLGSPDVLSPDARAAAVFSIDSILLSASAVHHHHHIHPYYADYGGEESEDLPAPMEKITSTVYDAAAVASADDGGDHAGGRSAASRMLRNLLGCRAGGGDINDAAVMHVKRGLAKDRPAGDAMELTAVDVSGGSRSFDAWKHGPRNNSTRSWGGGERKNKKTNGGDKYIPAAYRPMGGPTCS